MYPSTDNTQPITLLDLLQSVVRYRNRAAIAAGALLVSIAAVVMLLPKRYDSDAKLLVRLGKSSVGLDPTATTGQIISIQESRESEINSVLDMLDSRGLAEDVVDKVGAERILEKFAWVEQTLEALEGLIPSGGGVPTKSGKLTPEEMEQQQQRELAVKELKSMLQIKSPRKSTTISITCRGREPYLAQEIVQAVIDVYQQMHISAYQAEGSLQFFEEKFREQEGILAATQEQLRTAKNEMMMITIHGKQESLQQQINENQKMQLDTQAELVGAEARVQELQATMMALPTEIPSAVTSGIADASNDSMRGRLYELEIEEQELASKYSEGHPLLQKVRAQLASSRRIYNEQQKEREQSVVASNPVRERQHTELLSAKGALSSLQAKQNSLLKTAEDLRQKLEKVNQFELESDALQRKLDIVRETYQVYAKKLEESRINQAMQAESVSNVSIVQEPSLILRHTSPKRGLLLALAVVMSGLGGIAVAVLSEWFHRTQQSARQVHLDDLPVEGSRIPREDRIRIVSKTS